ncbi:MAG TPA: sulfite exporter TauE/SafE family protein [Mycobacteriales bacterium]|nr:sulfite exporter TauE/SafE family protein [Mycobacteriales bacterium]
MHASDALFLAAAGLLGGGVNAIAGGGSLVVFPAYVAIGYDTLTANVTNSVAQWPGYLGGVFGFRTELAGQRRRIGTLAAAGAAGAAGGCALLLATPASAFDAVVPFLVLLASLLLAVQPRMRRVVPVPAAGGRHLGSASGPDNMRVLLPVMFLAGAYGGYFGGALGVILIGVLSLTVPDTLRRTNALKSTQSLVISTVTVLVFALFGPVDWAGVAVVAPAALAGGYLGARLARRLDDRVLRWCVVGFGVAVAVLLYLRQLSLRQ